jgi:hypothetical protein
MSISFDDKEAELLRKLNRNSWSRTFSPDRDIDWRSSTTPEEYRALYDAWGLLIGTRHEDALSDEQRISFAQYQQINLMLATALFERCALANFESLYGDDEDPAYQEYVAHLIKEETYHYVLFTRAIARILETHPELRPLPSRPFKIYLTIVLLLLRWMPSRPMRHGMFFFLLRFIEEITLQANFTTKHTITRDDSLVLRVWELHAVDEARHVAFDDLMMRKARLPGILGRIPAWLTMPLCIGASLLVNLNEVWAARQLGVRVGYHELPTLMKKTKAPFKRRVFRALFDGLRSSEGAAT